MDAKAGDDTSEIWAKEALNIKFGIRLNTLAVGVFRNVDVPLKFYIYEGESEVDLEWGQAMGAYREKLRSCIAPLPVSSSGEPCTSFGERN